jgi:hypothetical protein
MKAGSIAAAFVILSAFGSARGSDLAQINTGDAYDLKSGVLLFREQHYRYGAGDAGQQLVLYRCPDGRPFARKLSRDDGNAQAPDFDLVDARLNYQEGVRRLADRREVYVKRTAELPEQAEPLVVPPDGVIDVGFDEFARRHWDDLAAGKTLSLPFLVPSRRVFYPFKARSDNTLPDNLPSAATLTVRLSLGAWYAFLVPHIDVIYDRASRRLVRYEGLSNIRNAQGKSYNVRIEFPHAPATATAQQIDAAASAPLTANCAVVRADTVAAGKGR